MYLGADPGLSGALAWVWDNGEVGQTIKMPATERDILDAIRTYDLHETRAVIEKVHSMPKQGVASTFKFGRNFGTLLMALTAVDIPFEEITPQRWQKEFSLVFPKSMNLSITEKKNRHKRKAQQLFPQMKITHAIADALLLAEYCRRRNQVAANTAGGE